MKYSKLSCSFSMLFAILTLGLSHQTAFGQNYQPLLNEGAHWNYKHFKMCEPFTWASYNYSMLLTGDTTIGENTYHKVYRQALEWDMGDDESCMQYIPHTIGYIGALREDPVERKVYLKLAFGDEVLLYNFAQEAGESVEGFIMENWQIEPPIIESVDSVLINGNYHKRLVINSELEQYIVEGIGSSFGLIDGYMLGVLDAPYTLFTCWWHDGQQYPETTEPCGLITHIEQEQTEHSPKIQVLPNPAVDYVQLAASNGQPLVRVDIFSLSGKQVMSHSPQSGNAWLDVSALPPGMYLIHAYSASGLHVAKMVKE